MLFCACFFSFRDNRTSSLCPSPFNTHCLTPPHLSSPLDSPIPSPNPKPVSPVPSPRANRQRGVEGGKLSASRSRSLTNLTVPQMNYMASSPQPMSYGRMPSPQPLLSPGNTHVPQLPSVQTPLGPTLISPTPVNPSTAASTSLPGLVSMLKRKSTGTMSVNSEPSCKARKNCNGVKIQMKAPDIKPGRQRYHQKLSSILQYLFNSRCLAWLPIQRRE